MMNKYKKHLKKLKKSYPSIIGSLIVILLTALLLSINNFALGKMLLGSSSKIRESDNQNLVQESPEFDASEETPLSSLTPSPTLLSTPSPSFSPLPLVTIPEDDLQARKDAFNQKVKEFVEKAKSEGESNTAIANTIRFQYELEFGTNADSQAEYSNCLVLYNMKLSEYNACMLSGSYGCYKPVNTCVKPLDAGF